MRARLALLLLLAFASGCGVERLLPPAPGLRDFEQAGLVAVPGGLVNAAGGNLWLERLDLSLDTLIGTQEIRAAYNASTGEWLWNFQVSYDGSRFVDETGAVHEVGGLADGAAIPGSVWIKVDADTLQTRGGMAYHFGPDRRLRRAGWASLPAPHLAYTWSAAELRIAQCPAEGVCADLFAVSLDAAGRPLSAEDLRSGRSAQFTWDAEGRLVGARDALDVAQGAAGWRYAYLAGDTLLAAAVNSEGERVEYVYQAGRRIWKVVQVGEGDPIHRFEFEWRGADFVYRTLHSNPLGGRARYAFDAAARLLELELLETGERAHWTWDGLRPATFSAADGTTTSFQHVDDDLVLRIEPSGNAVAISYEPGALHFDNPLARAVRRVEDAVGPVEERLYDAQGRAILVSNGAGEAVTYAYSASRLASITSPAGATSTFPVFGAHGHWLAREGAAADRRSYDAVGNALVTSAGGQLGGLLARGFDAERRVASLLLAATEEDRVTSTDSVALARGSDGRLRGLERPGGGAFEFAYDAHGRLAERRESQDGAWQATRFEYDAAGNPSAVTRPNGMREERGYDPYGRLVRLAVLREGVLEGEVLFAREAGRLVAVTDSLRGGAEVCGYDAAGRLASVVYPGGESVSYEYDLRSRRRATTFGFPGQGAILRLELDYDLADRPTRVSLGSGELLLEYVFADGQLVQVRSGNGLVRRFERDAESGLLSATHTENGLGELVEQTAVERAVRQAPFRYAVEVETWTALASTAEEYWLGVGGSLANPDRLVGKRVFGWNDGGASSRSFAYDELSNPRADLDGDAFLYDAEATRLLQASSASGETLDYAYDAAGFATARGGVPIAWTAAGRLASYGPLELEWDMFGRPIAWTQDGARRDFSRFGGQIESDAESGAPVALDLGGVEVGLGAAAGQRRYRHLDFRGNVSFVSDASGAIVSHYHYAPYGLFAAHGSPADARRFAGRPQLGELALLGARVYDPAVGRFLSPDPVFQAVNAYAYAMGNPVWYWDPDGAEPSALPESVDAALTQSIASLMLASATLGALGVVLPPLAPFTAAAAVVTGGSAAVLSFSRAFGLIEVQPQNPSPDVPQAACAEGCGPPAPVNDGCSFGPCSSFEGPGLTGGAGLGGGSPGTCAPLAPARVRGPAWGLAALAGLQLALGALLLRRSGGRGAA